MKQFFNDWAKNMMPGVTNENIRFCLALAVYVGVSFVHVVSMPPISGHIIIHCVLFIIIMVALLYAIHKMPDIIDKEKTK